MAENDCSRRKDKEELNPGGGQQWLLSPEKDQRRAAKGILLPRATKAYVLREIDAIFS